ncbi:DUF883 family protein [Caballeronia mineralivorans]|jgi:ElaB/YqjD/DUF883 family membrane-anchored ribosome-binding protein|uniref:DUF883 family protein n=1 Tax=Caballeronia mineralivorans TaxID=2010198 RepID=UPI002B000118|nr:DUF883 domain-containing protein [Caballeronia mineralivorans]MDB5789228.1 hypothetical protein [Caballeronia mineralivorans]MEA3100403.1 hypothetical protein [Caballeronia mineralivorans]
MSISNSAASDVNNTPATTTPDFGAESMPESGKVRARLKQARKKAADVQVVVIERGRKSASLANDYVHERPWSTAGVALGVGVLIGWLAGRK